MSYEIRCSLVTDLPELPDSLGLVFVQAVEDDTARMHSRTEKMAARFGLTKREAEVALLLIQRLHTNEIAEMLRISSHTVRHHTETIFRKTGITSRSELVGLASGLRERES